MTGFGLAFELELDFDGEGLFEELLLDGLLLEEDDDADDVDEEEDVEDELEELLLEEGEEEDELVLLGASVEDGALEVCCGAFSSASSEPPEQAESASGSVRPAATRATRRGRRSMVSMIPLQRDAPPGVRDAQYRTTMQCPTRTRKSTAPVVTRRTSTSQDPTEDRCAGHCAGAG